MGEGLRRARKAARESRKPVEKKGSFVVRLKCVVDKTIVCEDCTEQEAESDPWKYMIGEEQDDGMSDWEVKSVEPNN